MNAVLIAISVLLNRSKRARHFILQNCYTTTSLKIQPQRQWLSFAYTRQKLANSICDLWSDHSIWLVLPMLMYVYAYLNASLVRWALTKTVQHSSVPYSRKSRRNSKHTLTTTAYVVNRPASGCQKSVRD